jgi:hypothetical protein
MLGPTFANPVFVEESDLFGREPSALVARTLRAGTLSADTAVVNLSSLAETSRITIHFLNPRTPPGVFVDPNRERLAG